MDSQENAPITLLTLLSEIRANCEANDVVSLEAVHRQFNDAVRSCTRATKASNPSLAFFADWIARRADLVTCRDGRWERLSLDCWQLVREMQPDDREAFFLFWQLFEDFCALDERVVATVNYETASLGDEKPLRCELRQLYPEPGVYCRCYFRDEEAILGERISDYGFFKSSDTAKLIAQAEANVDFADWRPR